MERIQMSSSGLGGGAESAKRVSTESEGGAFGEQGHRREEQKIKGVGKEQSSVL